MNSAAHPGHHSADQPDIGTRLWMNAHNRVIWVLTSHIVAPIVSRAESAKGAKLPNAGKLRR
jgi:hypothetical protein